MIDLYFKNENDLSYNSLELEETTDLGNLISQIKMLLFTNRGEVLGTTTLGINLENLIFETKVSKEKIINLLNKQCSDFLVYDEKQYSIRFDLEFYKGNVRDIAVLNVIINDMIAMDVVIK